MATLDLTGGAPTDDDDAVAAAAAVVASTGAGGAEVIISAPASLEESIVAVLDPDQGRVQRIAWIFTNSAIHPVCFKVFKMRTYLVNAPSWWAATVNIYIPIAQTGSSKL